MYNHEANNLSKKTLDEQLQFLLNSRPNIRQVQMIDSVANMKADYLYAVDAIGIDASGNTVKVQFKCRQKGNTDLILPVKKLTGFAAENGDIGFWYKKEKYAFFPTANLYVEKIDGKNYSFSADELHGIEAIHADDLQDNLVGIQPKYVVKDDGTKFPSSDFFAFIRPDAMLRYQVELFKRANPNYNYGCPQK